MKIFGGYGQFYDQMKLNLAISSFGGQFWQQLLLRAGYSEHCVHRARVRGKPAAIAAGSARTCASQANFRRHDARRSDFPGKPKLPYQSRRRVRPARLTEEGVAPGLKPYKQHEMTAGFDYQVTRTLAFEARYDRRRLDHVIEDSAIGNPDIGETFVIVNPGEGINSNIRQVLQLPADSNLASGILTCTPTSTPSCPNIDTRRNAIMTVWSCDLTKATSNHWAGMFSYTFSRLCGNYTGLTSSDQADGGGGRNAPNNGRSFDEPFFSWNANGGSSSGLLPTDRPNTFKGYVYYDLNWMRDFSDRFGIFQVLYQGSPLTSYLDAGFAFATGFNVPNAAGHSRWTSLIEVSG